MSGSFEVWLGLVLYVEMVDPDVKCLWYPWSSACRVGFSQPWKP